jgi:hypothetical protein
MRWICLLALLVVAACTPASIAPTVTPTLVPTATPTATSTPLPQPTPLPRVLELTRATDPSQQAFLSVVHAAFDAPTFDVYVERLAIGANLSFGQHTQPSAIVAGDYFLRVVPNGVRPDAGNILYETQLSLTGGDSLLLIFTGAADALTMSYFQQPLAPLDSNQSRVTIVHAVPGGPEITLHRNGVPLTGAIPFGSAGTPITLPAVETRFDLRSGDMPLLDYSINLRERASYVLVLAGSPADAETLRVIETRNNVPGRARIRAVNASAAIGPVDIYLDNTLLAGGLAYTRASDRVEKPGQVYTVRVYPAGADHAAIEPFISSQIVANNDDLITLLLLGAAQDLRVLTYREDGSITGPNAARMTFVNTLPQVRTLRIETHSRELTEVGELTFGQPPLPVTLDTGSYRFVSMQYDAGSPVEIVESASDVQLEAGRSYLYLITGRLDDPPVILSDNVGFDQTLVGLSESELPTPIPEIPTRIRFINAVKGGLPVDFLVNSQLLVSGLSYGSSSAIHQISAGDHTIEVTASNQLLTSLSATLEPSTPYTVVVYGFGTDIIELMVIDDSAVFQEGDAPHFRVVNLTMFGELVLGLAHSNTSAGSPDPTIFSQSPGSDIFRRSLAFGIDFARTVTETPGRAYSNVALAPPGWQDVHAVDLNLNMIAATYRQLDFQPDTHYDIIAFQNRDSMLVEGFAVRYPAGSG